MRRAIVETSNTIRFLDAMAALEERGAAEACIGIVDGVPGLGKTVTVEHWVAQNGLVYLRADSEWKPPWMIRALLAELGVHPEHSFEKMMGQTVRALKERDEAYRAMGRSFAVVVDEFDYFVRSKRMLDKVRDLADIVEVPIVLVGMGRIRAALDRHEEFASRIGAHCEFQPATVDDVRAHLGACCDVPVGEDLVHYLHRVSAGLYREIQSAIPRIEEVGRRSAGPVAVADMVGHVLLVERKTGKAVVVSA